MSSNGRGTLAPSSPLSSPSFKLKRKSCARRFERGCCTCITYLPLVFVYGLTSWAVWVQTCVGLAPSNSIWIGYTSASVGIILYVLLNWSYTTAVFTDPGSPLTQTTDLYSVVPSADEEEEVAAHSQRSIAEQGQTSLTVKSTGEARYCKKCHSRKPDRAHHCSTCRRCVLKMDHHCPWLATCVGFRNYKPFILFLIYTSLFCWLCFAVSGAWVWNEMVGGNAFAESDRLMPVNNILLAVLAGIIALVLSGFTGWHIYLACTGQTTIESLEKTRYLAPIRKSMQHQPHERSRNPINDAYDQTHQILPQFTSQLREIHANALPGITRPEEGVSTHPSTPPPRHPSTSNPEHPATSSSPAHTSLRQNLAHSPSFTQQHPSNATANARAYAAAEARHERARYKAYLDEMDSSKLPNAFDLGWRRNLAHVFGPKASYWLLPVCNTTGDGWTWEASKKWVERRDELARERLAREREDAAFARERWETMSAPQPGMRANQPSAGIESRRRIEDSSSYDDEEEEDSDDDVPLARRADRLQQRQAQRWGREGPTSNWNDIPDDILAPSRNGRSSGAGERGRGTPANDR